ncbi:MAG: arsenic resistance N-acetyltransferase ArsN2 [Pseudomonadota bacterium]
MNIEPISELKDVLTLLSECGLPVSDISKSNPPQFFGLRSESGLVAVVGLELFESVGLLRSLAVSPNHRGHGIARQLVAFAERVATSRGVDVLFLLTTTASDFFEKLGFVPASRTSAPTVIQVTPQFSGLCPASSAFLTKPIAEITSDDSDEYVRQTTQSDEFKH